MSDLKTIPQHTNALVHETSPYLLQHAHNPVNWLPWGDVAFQKATLENKPILLSVGYSACHWCHVMERESFENLVIAAQMNALFVCVKVDREERPDVDSVYMNAVQVMTGSGGWPMTVFLTPDGQPFYGGTYFPPDDRYGRPGFMKVMQSVSDAWTLRPLDVIQNAAELTQHLQNMDRVQGVLEIDTALSEKALATLGTNFDAVWGGFGNAPKFPNPGALEFLLQYHQRTGSIEALEMLEKSLTGMGVGGLYDQLGGGFARYSTDERWLAPHFEKMLYDNAQLVRVYLHAYQVTKKPLYARIARETLDYVLREMTAEDGGFYSAQDADSEGIEGQFYVWNWAEIQATLGANAALFARAFGVTQGGNWEGKTILTLACDTEQLMAEFNLPADEIKQKLLVARTKLYALRSERVWPGRDEKVITAWNGMMLGAFAEGARVLSEPHYLAAALKNLSFIQHNLYTVSTGRLQRTFKDGQAKISGMLEDYALYALGALELYRTTFNPLVLEFAQALTHSALDHFKDQNGFFDTPDDGEKLIVRPKSFFDSAMPSGNGAIAMLLVALARLTGHDAWEQLALEPIKNMHELMQRQPTGFGSLLQALETHISPHREIVIVGDLQSNDTQALLAVLDARFLPHVSVAAAQAGANYLNLLEQRGSVGGQATAFVCQNMTCELPVTTPEALLGLLNSF